MGFRLKVALRLEVEVGRIRLEFILEVKDPPKVELRLQVEVLLEVELMLALEFRLQVDFVMNVGKS